MDDTAGYKNWVRFVILGLHIRGPENPAPTANWVRLFIFVVFCAINLPRRMRLLRGWTVAQLVIFR